MHNFYNFYFDFSIFQNVSIVHDLIGTFMKILFHSNDHSFAVKLSVLRWLLLTRSTGSRKTSIGQPALTNNQDLQLRSYQGGSTLFVITTNERFIFSLEVNNQVIYASSEELKQTKVWRKIHEIFSIQTWALTPCTHFKICDTFIFFTSTRECGRTELRERKLCIPINKSISWKRGRNTKPRYT